MNIKYIMIHCSQSPNGRDDRAKDIHRWHLEKGYDGIGYHYVICRDGQIETGRPEYWTGAHEQSVNRFSIGICMIGTDKFSDRQWESLRDLVYKLKFRHQDAKVVGHYEFDTNKTCPEFNVPEWFAKALPGMNNGIT